MYYYNYYQPVVQTQGLVAQKPPKIKGVKDEEIIGRKIAANSAANRQISEGDVRKVKGKFIKSKRYYLKK